MQQNNKIKQFPKKKIWNGLTITDMAALQICNLVELNTGMLGLRLTIKKFGCAGFGYVVEKVIKINDSDLLYEHDNAKLFVSLKAMPFIDGTEVDYVQEGLNSMFKFNNPNAKNWCGCGDSFNI